MQTRLAGDEVDIQRYICVQVVKGRRGDIHGEIRWAICMVDRVKLLGIIKIDVNVTRRITAISYFPKYLGQ